MTTQKGRNWIYDFIYGYRYELPEVFSVIRGAKEVYAWYYAQARLHALCQGGP